MKRRRKLKVPKLKYGISVDLVERAGGERPAKEVTLSWEARKKTFVLSSRKAPRCIKSVGPDYGRVPLHIYREMCTKAAAILKGIDD